MNNDTDKNLCDALRNFVKTANESKAFDAEDYADLISDSVTYYMKHDFDYSSAISDYDVEQYINDYCDNNASDIIRTFIDDNLNDHVDEAVQTHIDGAIDNYLAYNPNVLTEYFKTNEGKIALADALFDLFERVKNAKV